MFSVPVPWSEPPLNRKDATVRAADSVTSEPALTVAPSPTPGTPTGNHRVGSSQFPEPPTQT